VNDAAHIRQHLSLPSAVALLQAEGLPTSDLTKAALEQFFFVGSDGSPTAIVGLEIYGKEALIRSLVVASAARKDGLGSKLVSHAEGYAKAQGVKSLYLLTTTAEAFFQARGYSRLDRQSAPSSIQATKEFAALCPASSAFMTKPL
jgi:amino-acid N-acetyltransferase